MCHFIDTVEKKKVYLSGFSSRCGATAATSVKIIRVRLIFTVAYDDALLMRELVINYYPTNELAAKHKQNGVD